MFVDWLLASFHHLAVFSLAAILSAEIFLTAGPIDDRMVLRIARVDAWFGIMAALVVAAGVLRVFFGATGYEYYWANIFFWGKMALFVGVGLVSVRADHAVCRLEEARPRRSVVPAAGRPRSNNYARPFMSRQACSPSFRYAPRRWRAATGCDGL